LLEDIQARSSDVAARIRISGTVVVMLQIIPRSELDRALPDLA
jgi:hypothetical protein